jgi:hypothetical protein
MSRAYKIDLFPIGSLVEITGFIGARGSEFRTRLQNQPVIFLGAKRLKSRFVSCIQVRVIYNGAIYRSNLNHKRIYKEIRLIKTPG